VRLWKRELQKLANELGLDIVVSHLPPAPASGTKSNTGLLLHQPELARHAACQLRVIVELISATTTKTGLTVRCELDTGNTPAHCRLGCRDAAINIKRAEFHGEWNYTISPKAYPQIARLFPDKP